MDSQKKELSKEDWIRFMSETPYEIIDSKEYWSSKSNWIDVKPRMKLNLHTYDSEEEYRRMRQEVREIMELNMVLYGKW